MTILPVTDLEERTKRSIEAWGFPVNEAFIAFATQKFYAHLRGLERFAGKRVLEIGGTEAHNLADYFGRIGAYYEQVGLEPTNGRSYARQMNFIDLPVGQPYDLVISLGVFEVGAIDHDVDSGNRQNRRTNNSERLAKLHELTAKSGFNVIGTISDPCMFSNDEITRAGFKLQYRRGPFYCGSRDYSSFHSSVVMVESIDRSELLLLLKLSDPR